MVRLRDWQALSAVTIFGGAIQSIAPFSLSQFRFCQSSWVDQRELTAGTANPVPPMAQLVDGSLTVT